MIHLVIYGRMVPKKNSKRHWRNCKFPVSSKRFKDYETDAKKQLISQYQGAIIDTERQTIHVKALYYCPDRRFPDVSAMHETVGDLLEGIVYKNDRQIEHWDGSRVLLDRENPRLEIWVE